MLQSDITYEVKKIEEYMDESKIIEFTDYIIKYEFGEEEYDKNDFYLSLLITTNEIIQKINKEYRGKDMPTDVISFAYNETENIGPINVIGDIIISIDRVKEQAKEYNHSEEREFYYVLCHGMLHLLGYDHMTENEKGIMRKKEEEILEKFKYKRTN